MKKQLDLFSKSHLEWKNQLNKSAERKIDFEIIEPRKRKTVKKSYADNFLK